VTIGTVIGVLPGLGPTATIAMLLPLTFTLEPVSALIMLAGIYYGAQYGGSTTAILINLPGEASSVVTCIDGYAMAKQGRAGPALAVAAIGSLFAGCFSTAVIALFAPPLADVALKFGSAEYFSLVTFGLVAAVLLARGSALKAIAMVFLGLLMGLVGTDINSGFRRFTFEIPQLWDGIHLLTVVVGLFAFAEILLNLEANKRHTVLSDELHGLMPTKQDLKASVWPVIRGTGLGSLLGILPGGGAILSSFSSYTLEKKIASDPSRFGKGAIEGVAGPEAANNAGAQTSFIPLLTLGIPSNGVMALMLGAMMIHGITPGPAVMIDMPKLFWGMITSMLIGNIMLVILNLPLIGIWVSFLKVPYRMLYPSILLFCCLGTYSLAKNGFDVALTAAFGFLGYVLIKLDCEPVPLVLGYILGPMMELHLRRALLLSRGDPSVFFTRPISFTFLFATAALLVILILPVVRSKREEVFQE
jgi:TctA family transporter